jgi:hypothetical protein
MTGVVGVVGAGAGRFSIFCDQAAGTAGQGSHSLQGRTRGGILTVRWLALVVRIGGVGLLKACLGRKPRAGGKPASCQTLGPLSDWTSWGL